VGILIPDKIRIVEVESAQLDVDEMLNLGGIRSRFLVALGRRIALLR
jgi:hypothetical protein